MGCKKLKQKKESAVVVILDVEAIHYIIALSFSLSQSEKVFFHSLSIIIIIIIYLLLVFVLVCCFLCSN
jgi:hypothetical protein